MAGISQLAKIQSDDRILNQIQDQNIRSLNPILSNVLMQGLLLTKIPLMSGFNTINHKLGRNLIGWFLVRNRASSVIYDTQDINLTPDLTLTLNTSASTVVDLWVF